MAKAIKSSRRPDYFLLGLIFILTVFGLVILASASSDIGKIRFNDTYYHLKHQLLFGFLPGIFGFILVYRFPYTYLRKLALFLFLANLGLLLLVFTPLGVTAGGATRWLALGPLTFQPAELLKITFMVYLAAWLANSKISRSRDLLRGVLPFLVISGAVAGLLLLQPATSMAVILISAGLIIYFLGGARWRHIFLMVLVGLAIFALLTWFTPYRRERVLSFLNPGRDVEGASFQINQALITIGSGGFWGIGYGKSTTKVNTLPAPLGDSIFAIAAQELGFVGAGGLVLLFMLMVFRVFWLAKKAPDQFGQLLLVGFGAILALQAFVHIAAISGLIPLTGMPLPFVSYGGTALAVFLIMGGIAVNVSRYV